MKMIYKLSLGMLAIALLIPLVGLWALHSSQQALERSIGQVSVDLAEEIVGVLDRHIHARIQEFQTYSKGGLLQDTLARSNQEFEALEDIQGHIGRLDEAWTSVPKEELTPAMQELLDDPLSQEFRDIIQFHERKYGYRTIGEVFLTNRYGANVAQSGKTTDYRQGDETWWQEARRDGVHVAEVEYDRSAEIYSTDIAIAIEDTYRDFAGVLKVVLNIEEAIKVIDEAQVKELFGQQEPEAFRLLTADGKVIYSTREFTLFEDASGWLPEEVLSAPGTARAGTFTTNDTVLGEVLCAYARSAGHRDFHGLGWILVLEHDKDKIHAPIAALRSRIWWASLIAALVGLGLGAVVAGSISSRIARLQKGAEIIGSGNLDYQIGSTARDEVGALSRAFDRMAANLKEITASRDEMNTEIAVRERTEETLRHSMAESERLLLNILPQAVAKRLKRSHGIIADRFDDVTILFADIVGFTRLAAHVPAIELVGLLNEIFSGFDRLTERHGVEKIKTIGDRYMAAGGLPVPREDHAEAVAAMALDMMDVIARFNEARGRAFNIQIGIHTGPVVAGIIGLKKFVYDLWGDTVITASSIETHGVPGCIQVSETTYERLRGKFLFDRREIQIKGKGDLTAYILTGVVAHETAGREE